MPTKSGLPGWFPEDFKTDPELHAAFDDAAEWHAHARKTASGKRAGQAGKPRSHQHARAWDELAAVIELSAETGRLSVTPAPYGKPGGPGLYGVAGNKHSDYYEQIVKALMEKRGMDKGRASAIAWGVLRKWAHGGGKVTPEVSAAATRALAEEDAARAKAHAHSVTWDDVALTARHVIDLAAAPPPQQQQSSGSGSGPVQPRVPAGQAGGGQFGSGSGQPTAAQAHAAHVAHVAHVTGASTQKAALLVTAADDRQKAAALIKQRDALVKALASAGGAVSSGQAGAKTAKTATTKTSAPATAKTASTAPATASTTAASTAPAKASTAKTAAAPAASGTTGSASAMKAQVAALNTQISGLLAQAAQATAQAAAMK